MTIVVCWYKEQNQAIHMAADSRLGPADGRAVTLKAPKVLPIPILARRAELERGPDLFPERRVINFPYDVGAYGYGYAGSSTAALCAHSSATACLANLVSTGIHPLPSVEMVANLYCHFADRIVEHGGLQFEAIVTGYCRRSHERRLFYISRSIQHNAYLAISKDLGNEEYFAIGSGQAVVAEYLNEARKINPSCGMLHALILAIRGDREDLDGHLHFGSCSESEDFANYKLLNRLPGKFAVETEIFGTTLSDVDLGDFRVGGYDISGNFVPIPGYGL